MIVVFRSAKQASLPAAVTAVEREAETLLATKTLGCTYEQWSIPDTHGDPWRDVLAELLRFDDVDEVFAPAFEADGHAQHNLVAEAARSVFGDRVTGYLTYTRSGGRSRDGDEVFYDPEWIAVKLHALACYRSQMREPSCRPWFLQPDLREWVAR